MRFRSSAPLGASLALVAGLLLSAVPAIAAEGTDDVFWWDGPYAGVTCAYPEDDPATIDRIRVKGPRVEFPPSVGEVGWVRWTTLVQERTAGSSDWQTIASRRGRIVVDVYQPRTFKVRVIDVPPGPAASRLRVVGAIRWIDQGGDPAGKVRHIMQRYDRVHVAPGDPIKGAAPEVEAGRPCPRTWALP